MANSERYNNFYRDLDLIENAPKPKPARSIGVLFRIANALQHKERLALLALGYSPRDAFYDSWLAFQGVVDIDMRPMPTIYQTTEAKTITGKGRL